MRLTGTNPSPACLCVRQLCTSELKMNYSHLNSTRWWMVIPNPQKCVCAYSMCTSVWLPPRTSLSFPLQSCPLSLASGSQGQYRRHSSWRVLLKTVTEKTANHRSHTSSDLSYMHTEKCLHNRTTPTHSLTHTHMILLPPTVVPVCSPQLWGLIASRARSVLQTVPAAFSVHFTPKMFLLVPKWISCDCNTWARLTFAGEALGWFLRTDVFNLETVNSTSYWQAWTKSKVHG